MTPSKKTCGRCGRYSFDIKRVLLSGRGEKLLCNRCRTYLLLLAETKARQASGFDRVSKWVQARALSLQMGGSKLKLFGGVLFYFPWKDYNPNESEIEDEDFFD